MLSILIFIALMLTSGYPLLLRLWPESDKLSRWPLAFLLGSSLITLELFFWIFLFRWPSNYWLLLFFITQIIVLWWWFDCWHFNWWVSIQQLSTSLKSWRRGNILVYFLGLLLLAQIVIGASVAWMKPVVHYDSLTMWTLKPALLLADPAGFFDGSSPHFQGLAGQPNYPWQIPLSVWLQAKINGELDPAYLNYIYYAYFLSALILIYSALKNQGRLKALIITNLLATTPLFFYHSWNAYADLPLAVYALAGLIAWLAYQRGKISPWPALIFWGLAFWVKNEGALFLAVALIILAVQLLQNGQWRKKWQYALMALPVIVWLIWLKLTGLGLAQTSGSLGWHPEVLMAFFSAFWSFTSWNILWYVAPVFLLLYYKEIWRNQAWRLAWLWWVGVLLSFLVVYLFTPAYLYAVEFTAIQRNIIILVPVLFLLIGLEEEKKDE